MTRFLAIIIEALNHDTTLGKMETPTEKINELLESVRAARG